MKTQKVSLRNYLLLPRINIVVRFLIFSDIILVGSAGLLAPVFALFIEDFIVGGDALVAGVAAAVFLITKSLLQMPLATLIDKIKGERDDFWILVLFSFATALLPLLYLIIHTPPQLYLVQFVLGVFTAFTYPSFMAIFTRHIDKWKEGTEWGVYFTLVDLSNAGFASLGGVFVVHFGYHILIIAMTMVSMIGVALLLPIRPYLKYPRGALLHSSKRQRGV